MSCNLLGKVENNDSFRSQFILSRLMFHIFCALPKEQKYCPFVPLSLYSQELSFLVFPIQSLGRHIVSGNKQIVIETLNNVK
jgi:hypothetical protein